MNSFSTDVCVIGAGPGGCATSLQLSKLGIDCLLIDKATFPRDKICGDALSGKVVVTLNRIDKNIMREITNHNSFLPSWGVKFIAPNLKELKIPFKKNYDTKEIAPGFISKRIDFDNFLFEQTKKKPTVKTLEGIELTQFEKQYDGWILYDKQNSVSIKTKMVVAADGAHSRFAKEIGKINVEHGHYCAGIRAYYKGVKNLDTDGFIELHFLKDFLPGYFWIFPLPNGYANIGVGMRSDFVSRKKINLKTSLLEIIEKYPLLKERFSSAELIADIKGYGLPLGSKKRNISGENFLLVGDAASLIDPFTGEGIGNAMISGVKAAEQVVLCLKENNFSASFMKQYDDAVYKRLWSELSLSKKMQDLVKHPWLFNLVANKAVKSKSLQHIIMSMFEDLDIRKQLKSPKFYFKILFTNR